MSERIVLVLLTAVLVGVGALAWSLELRPGLRVEPAALASLPRTLGPWRSEELELEAQVESMLRADYNLQRAYIHPLGEVVFFYIGYYGTDRGGYPEHTPSLCYPSAGWSILDARTLVRDRERGLRVNEFVVENSGERRLVHFWYRTVRRSGMLGQLQVRLDQFLGRIRGQRADGGLVRISTPLRSDDEVVVARGRLMGFAELLEDELGRHWPDEVPEA